MLDDCSCYLSVERNKIHRNKWKRDSRKKPVFQSKKIGQVLAPKEKKPPIVSNQCVVYKFQCNLCDADYVGYTTRHLHQRIGEHKYSAIGRHIKEHGLTKSALEDKQFSILKKCRSKFDCLVFEMLLIKELSPVLNTQKDSIRVKLFTWLFACKYFILRNF